MKDFSNPAGKIVLPERKKDWLPGILLAFLLFFLIPESAYCQNRLDSLRVVVKEDQSLVELLAAIEKQSSLRFYYKRKWLDSFNVSVELNSHSLGSVLWHVLDGSPISFMVVNKFQVIFLKDQILEPEFKEMLVGKAPTPVPETKEKPETLNDQKASVEEPLRQYSKPVNHYLGVQANQLLRQLFSFNDDNGSINNPYLIQYAVNSSATGKGINIGLNLTTSTFEDDANILPKTRSFSFFFRVGYERKIPFAKRFLLSHGIDLLLENTKSRTNSGTIFIETASSGLGIGPRFAMLFRIHENTFLGTEASYYFKSINDRQTITNQPESNQKSTNFSFSLPVALFLILKF